MNISNKILTLDDVKLLNAERNSVVELQNTAGQSAEIIKQLHPSVSIRIIGGYDAEAKKKYDNVRIQKRTIYTPNQVYLIISRFEQLEKNVDPNWNDLEKAAYMYQMLGTNIKYDSFESKGVETSNLYTVLGGGVCAGYASVYKEAMDRLGVKCEIINKQKTHSWNAINIDGKWFPVDLTWDAANIKNKKPTKWFAQNEKFSESEFHQANGEGERMVPDNCLPPHLIEEAFKKTSGKVEMQNTTQMLQRSKLTAKTIACVGFSKDKEQIVGMLQSYFDLSAVCNDLYENYERNDASSFGKETYEDKIAGECRIIRKTVKGNAFLLEEEKANLIRLVNAYQKDYWPKSKIEGLPTNKTNNRSSLKQYVLNQISEIEDYLKGVEGRDIELDADDKNIIEESKILLAGYKKMLEKKEELSVDTGSKGQKGFSDIESIVGLEDIELI
ncbi:MAG: hypothetical protein IKJ33_00860 [Clostridia bacterium]|nr:hypothetical protein [Clostridia bacterium]